MIKKTYNSQEWEIECYYTNLKDNKVSLISSDSIVYIKIVNTLENYIPSITMRFIDKGYELLNNLNTSGTFIKLKMIEPLQTYNTEQVELDITMIVNDIKILSIDQQLVKFEVQCTHVHDMELSKNIIYSNNKEQGQISPYKVISDVVNQTDCYLDEDYVDTSQRIDFITSQSMMVKDVIRYCLEKGVSHKDPPTYFFTRLLDQDCVLFNMFSDYHWMNQVCNDPLVFLTNGNDSTDNSMGRFIDSVISNMPNGGINSMKLLSTYQFNEYDHNKRLWTQKIYNGKMLSKLLNSIEEIDPNILNNIMAPVGTTDYNHLVKNFPNFSQHKIYNTFRDLELLTKNISFLVFGNLSRDCGQLINLKVEKEELKPQLAGSWTIYSCVHIWEDVTYMNDITCYRTVQLKPVENKK